ncbi:type VI secretion system tube protein Hcp, partial [Flavobacterium sp.]|uniref:type VI secretion system tube protein Hcp n=1 Tax=Flavobacterium sp. TaxID=239 RepID=UPI0038FC7099
ITIALVAITSFTSQLFAQEVSAVAPAKASYDLKKNVKARVSQTDGKTMAADDWDANNAKAAQGKHFPKATLIVCRVTPTDDGCVVTLESSITSPRDAASGLATGKRMHKPMSVHVSSSDNTVSEVKSPRDMATGQSTGKRQHKPIRIPKEYNATTPKLFTKAVQGKSSSDSPPSEIAIDEPGVHKGGGTGKVSYSDLSVTSAGKATFKEFTVTKRCGGKTTEIRCPNGDCEIPLDDCPNGAADLVCSWSWGMSNSGTMSPGSGAGSGRSSVGFSLEIEDGACTAMAINEKGLPGDKKPNTSTTNNPK